MSRAPSRRSLRLAVPALAGASVVAFAAGSGPLASIKHAGDGARWVLLAALTALAAAWVRDVRSLPRLVPITAGVLVALALLSSAWSVDPRLSFERAVTLALLLVCVLLLAAGVRSGGLEAEPLLVAVLAAAVCVAVAGLLVLAFDRPAALQEATYGVATRYKGFGENPNTVTLLLAVTLPLATWQALCGRTRLRSAFGAAAALLFAGSIAAADSRGALIAGFAASVVVVALATRGRRRILAAAAAAAVFGASVFGATIPAPGTASSAPPPAHAAKPNPYDVEQAYPLAQDIGTPLPGGGQKVPPRSLLDTSGRGQAWTGALHLIAGRPLLGYGFGTEEHVFVDRYAYFAGSRPEDSYLGIALQLGVLGLLALLLLVGAALAALRTHLTATAAACAGVAVAGLVMAVVQSYLYSVGNIAALSFWLATLLLPAVAVRPQPAR